MSDPFAALGLAPALVRAVADQGYSEPTPVQVQAIPVILAGRDVLAGAQTGTGKTAGFALPMLQRLEHHAHHGGRHAVRALVLTPTRELAAQVEEAIRAYGAHLKLRTALVYGGVGFSPQAEALERGVDILVATPGRLLDHAGQETVNLSHVEILVLDEADRMLDMGFIHDIRKVLALLPAKRQNLLFSATFSDEIRALAHGLLHDPVTVQVARRNAESDLVNQHFYQVAQGHKRAALTHLVRAGDWHQVLVFTRTKHGANRLAEQLCRDGVEATAIHGNKSQGARTRALAGFKSGEVRVLVATDLAARGLDIEELPHVVVYDLPHVAEDYVHRIGRTGRAGATGDSIAFVAPEEDGLLAQIEKLLGRRFERAAVPGFDPSTLPPPAPRPPQQESARSEGQREQRGQRGGQGPRQQGQQRSHQGQAGQGQAGQGQRRGERPRPGGPRPPQQPPARPGPGRASQQPPQQQRVQDGPPAQGLDDDERQPTSHENALFPSSGDAFTPPAAPRRDRNARRGRQQQVPALLRGTPRRNG